MTQLYGSRYEETHQRSVGTSSTPYRTSLTAADKSQIALNSVLFKTPNQVGAAFARVFAHVELNTSLKVDCDVWVRRIRKDQLVDPTGFLKTTNNGSSYTSYLTEVKDDDATTHANLNSLGTLADQDYILIGYSEKFKGISLEIDPTNKNSNAANAAVHYWNGAWTALTIQDGTKTHNTTLAHDGEIQWATKPEDWQQSTINGITAYWVRFSVSNALSANVDVEECGVMLDNGYVGKLDTFSVEASEKQALDFAIAGDDVAVTINSLNGGSAAVNLNLGWH